MQKKLIPLLASLFLALPALAAPTLEMEIGQDKATLGKVTLELYPEKAPKTVEMFLYNAKHGFYEGTIFHRVIDGFMIQGGGFMPTMEEKKPRTPDLRNEADNGLGNQRGTLAMARTPDPHSARVQFFINLKDNDFLNGTSTKDGYAVFGEVVTGMDVVRKLGRAPTGSKGFMDDVPVRPVIIESVKVLK